MAKNRHKHLADPIRLKPIDPKGKTLQVIIETLKGLRNKYAYDLERGVFSLAAVLPAGMAFTYDFRFLPETLPADGDAIDVLLIDGPALHGGAIESRLIGVIEASNLMVRRKFVTTVWWQSLKQIRCLRISPG